MKRAPGIGRERGSSTIELALILPLLLFLIFVAVDFSRAIQMNNILVNLTREGADQLSRSNVTPQFAQYVMNALGDTAMPSYQDAGQTGTFFEQNSAIVVTQIQGKLNAKGTVDATVTEQYKWLRGAMAPASELWNCGNNWKTDGSCTMPGTLPVITLSVPLNNGDIIYAVEALHTHDSLFGGVNLGMGAVVPTVGANLYSVAMF